MFSASVKPRTRASRWRSSGTNPDRPGQPQLAFRDDRSPRERSQQLSLPCPFNRRESDDLAGANREVLHVSNGDESPIIQHIDSGRGYNDATDRLTDWSAGRERQVLAEHRVREIIRRPDTRGGAQHDSPAPQHRYVVRNAQRFVQLVGDENDGVPVIGEAPQPRRNKLERFSRGENSRWLVEYECLRIARQRLDEART